MTDDAPEIAFDALLDALLDTSVREEPEPVQLSAEPSEVAAAPPPDEPPPRRKRGRGRRRRGGDSQ